MYFGQCPAFVYKSSVIACVVRGLHYIFGMTNGLRNFFWRGLVWAQSLTCGCACSSSKVCGTFGASCCTPELLLFMFWLPNFLIYNNICVHASRIIPDAANSVAWACLAYGPFYYFFVKLVISEIVIRTSQHNFQPHLPASCSQRHVPILPHELLPLGCILLLELLQEIKQA